MYNILQMPRRTKNEAHRTRERILASALSLFVKKGYDRTTFTDIAARLKMTKGAVYWHFATKELLLGALVDEMLAKFSRQLSEIQPRPDELSFPTVADMMVATAERIVSDPRGTAFFMLMKTQIRWQSASMAATRERLMMDGTNGPYHSFVRALENDVKAGRVRTDVNPAAVASVAIAIWDGLVQSRIERFLACELGPTLKKAYAALWISISAGGSRPREVKEG